MDANPLKSGRGRFASGRVRGVILSPQGWQRFQAAKQQAEATETWGEHFSQEDLSDRTKLSSIPSSGFSSANKGSIVSP